MLSRLKSAARSTITFTGKVLFSAGTFVGQLGGSLFSTQNTADYVAKSHNENLDRLIAIPVMFASAFVTVVTLLPAINRKFNKLNKAGNDAVKTDDGNDYKKIPDSEEESENTDTSINGDIENQISDESENEKSCCANSKCCGCHSDLNCLGKSIFYFLSSTGFLSSIFASSKRYLDGITLGTFIATLCKTDLNDPENEWKNNVVVAAAVILAVSKFAAYLSFNYSNNQENARDHAKKIQTHDYTWNRYTTITAAISVLPLIGSSFSGYFSQQRSFLKMNGLKSWPVEIRNGIAGLSAFTQITSTLTTQTTELYKKISGAATHNYHTKTAPCWEPSLRWNTYAWGLIDAAVGGLGTFIGVMTTMNELFNTDLYNPYLIPVAGLAGLGTTCMSFTFNVMKAYEDVYNYEICTEEKTPVHTPDVNTAEQISATTDAAASVSSARPAPTNHYRNANTHTLYGTSKAHDNGASSGTPAYGNTGYEWAPESI